MIRVAIASLLALCIGTAAMAGPGGDELTWRQKHPPHYYNYECCYCAKVDKILPSKTPHKTSIYVVDGKQYELPHSIVRPADPDKPEPHDIICDPVQQESWCVLKGVTS